MPKLISVVVSILKRVVSDWFPNKYEIVFLICTETVIVNNKTHSMCEITNIIIILHILETKYMKQL